MSSESESLTASVVRFVASDARAPPALVLGEASTEVAMRLKSKGRGEVASCEFRRSERPPAGNEEYYSKGTPSRRFMPRGRARPMANY